MLDEAQWLSVRDTCLTSTDLAPFFAIDLPISDPRRRTILNRKSPFAIHHYKTGKAKPEDLTGVERVEIGTVMQPVMGRLYRQRTNHVLEEWSTPTGRPRFFARSTKVKGLGASFDGVGRSDGNSLVGLAKGEQEIVEFKNVDYLIFRDFWYNTNNEVEAPFDIFIQAQTMLAADDEQQFKHVRICPLVAGNQFWCGTTEGQNRNIIVERDDVVIGLIHKMVEAFWDDVANDRVPSPDGFAATAETIKQVYNKARGYKEPVDLSADLELAAWLAERAGYALASKNADQKLDDYAALIKVRLGETDLAICGDYKLNFKADKNGRRSLRITERVSKPEYEAA